MTPDEIQMAQDLLKKKEANGKIIMGTSKNFFFSIYARI